MRPSLFCFMILALAPRAAAADLGSVFCGPNAVFSERPESNGSMTFSYMGSDARQHIMAVGGVAVPHNSGWRVEPLRRLAGTIIDAEAFILGHLPFGSVFGRIAAAYDHHLFKGATLQDLPDEPRFVDNATNVEPGVLWRFMKPYIRDYCVAEVKTPTVTFAHAVAASSAIPPVLDLGTFAHSATVSEGRPTVDDGTRSTFHRLGSQIHRHGTARRPAAT